MKSLEYYERLPDSMKPGELRDEFLALLATPAVVDPPVQGNHIIMAEALVELSDRQWHAYEPLTDEVRDAVSGRVLEIWSDSDADQAGRCLAIVARLGLGDAFRSLASLASASLHPDVRRELQEAVREFGASVDDPWAM